MGLYLGSHMSSLYMCPAYTCPLSRCLEREFFPHLLLFRRLRRGNLCPCEEQREKLCSRAHGPSRQAWVPVSLSQNAR